LALKGCGLRATRRKKKKNGQTTREKQQQKKRPPTTEKKHRNSMQRHRSRRGKDPKKKYSVKGTTEKNKETLYEKRTERPPAVPLALEKTLPWSPMGGGGKSPYPKP
jgi:hypothetical protein